MTSTTEPSRPAPQGDQKKQAPDPAQVAAAQNAAAQKLLRQAVDGGLAFLRKVDPDAAADLDAMRRRELSRPAITARPSGARARW
jgi:hypothetical protein